MEVRYSTLLEALGRSWSEASSSKWTMQNPAQGQCGVTALVVQDRLSGEIVKTRLPAGWHFYNRIDGRRCDFTAHQFDEPIHYDDLPATREEAFSDTNDDQYRALRARLAGIEAREQA